MAVEVLTLSGVVQFTGLAGAGLFTFSHLNNIPRTTRVSILTLAYTEFVDDPIETNLRVFATHPGPIAAPTARVLLGQGLWQHGLLDPVDGNAYLKLCGYILPREPDNGGRHWNISVFSEGKANAGSFTIDYVMCPGPDTDPSDSPK